MENTENNQNIHKDEGLWELCNDIWKNATNYKKEIEKYYGYYNGKFKKDAPIYETFNKETHTPFNYIKPIINTKIEAMLDAQFNISVLPKIKYFNTYEEIKNQEIVADIFDYELNNIFKKNNFDLQKKEMTYDAFIAGYTAMQVSWDIENDIKGEVKITPINSKNLRWDKNATDIKNNTFFAYSFHENIGKAKEKYCKNPDGTYNLELCNIIDKISTQKQSSTNESFDKNKIISYSSDTYNIAGVAYASKRDGIQYNKYVKLVVLFLMDDSIYSPDEDDKTIIEETKKRYVNKYPNGRMIIFSTNEEEKIIFKDEALPESFNSLGNIGFFNPVKTNEMKGYTDIADLIPLQERINGLSLKMRKCISDDYTGFVVNKDSGLKEGSFVSFPIITIETTDTLQTISNEGATRAQIFRQLIEDHKQDMYNLARVNETMLYGQRQTGTTSADQVEALQESPLSQIRSYQRNFINFIIDISQKCLKLMMNNYNFDRVINLMGHDKYSLAEVQVLVNANTGEETKILKLINKNGEQENIIEFNSEWDFDVEIIAGTELPRTRKENASLYDKMLLNGIFEKIQDPDLLEVYLRSQDIPNYREIIKLFRRKHEERQLQENGPETSNAKNVIKNPILTKSLKDFMYCLEGYPEAKQQIIAEMGLNPTPAKLDNTPVTETVRQGEVEKVVAIAPQIVSANPISNIDGYNEAKEEKLEDVIEYKK